MNDGNVTIAIPHFQTLDLIRLCLRSIRKLTSPPYEVIVIDNGSKDASLDYLRSVTWIQLIERHEESMKSESWAHGSALDIGLKHTETEFFLSVHSDVVIQDAEWLHKLIDPFKQNPRIACAGSGKLEEISAAYHLFKKLGDIKGLIRFLRKTVSHDATIKNNYRHPEYIRTICALYRTDILKQEHLSFLPVEEKGLTSGQHLYYELMQRGYHTNYFPPSELKRMIDHLNHGTMVLNPLLGARKRTIRKGVRKMKNRFSEEKIKRLLTDASLDT